MDGYILVHKGLVDSCVFDDPIVLKIWIWCLCKASHKERDSLIGNQSVHILPGQFIFGRIQAAGELNITASTLYRKLKLLEKMSMIKLKTDSKWTVATVVNWNSYRDTISEVGKIV